jgi:hypothetical protein
MAKPSKGIALRERPVALPVVRAVEPPDAGHNPFERSSAERRASALGLARFKVSQGLTEQAWAIPLQGFAIARQFSLTPTEVGLDKAVPILMLNAA